jgi:hypothetical protein
MLGYLDNLSHAAKRITIGLRCKRLHGAHLPPDLFRAMGYLQTGVLDNQVRDYPEPVATPS